MPPFSHSTLPPSLGFLSEPTTTTAILTSIHRRPQLRPPPALNTSLSFPSPSLLPLLSWSPSASPLFLSPAPTGHYHHRPSPSPASSKKNAAAGGASVLTTMDKLEQVETLLDSIKWDSKGLAVAIAQNVDTGAILMQGFINREALAATISSQKATFYSRSRSALWTKGETSMNFIHVHDIFLDCDRDSIIYLGKPDGPTCHTGAETCYYSSVYDVLDGSKPSQDRQAETTLYSLESTISSRKEEIDTQNGKPSWTKKLLLNNELLCSKICEEAGELAQTLLKNEDRARTISEMGDLLYHAMVLLKVKEVKMEEVFEILRKRFSQSGIEEKNSRNKS